jgi:hypothetical protein
MATVEAAPDNQSRCKDMPYTVGSIFTEPELFLPSTVVQGDTMHNNSSTNDDDDDVDDADDTTTDGNIL